MLHQRSFGGEVGEEHLDGSTPLRAEAGSEHGNTGGDRVAQEPLLRVHPGIRVGVVGAHRAAHHDHGIKLAMLRQCLARVELDTVQTGAVLVHHVLVDARRLAGDVLQHQDVGVARRRR